MKSMRVGYEEVGKEVVEVRRHTKSFKRGLCVKMPAGEILRGWENKCCKTEHRQAC